MQYTKKEIGRIMSRIYNLLFVLLATILFSCSSRPIEIFVATNGSDINGTGAIGQPYASLERARDEIREQKQGRNKEEKLSGKPPGRNLLQDQLLSFK